jgi:hypothetical protein
MTAIGLAVNSDGTWRAWFYGLSFTGSWCACRHWLDDQKELCE